MSDLEAFHQKPTPMFKFLSKGKAKKQFSALIVARLNDRTQPIERGDLYEDPLQEWMEAEGIGEVTGGGTQLGEAGEIAFCDVEMCVQDLEQPTISAVIEMLEKLGAPKGSTLLIEGRKDTQFGKLEGLAVYLNGTDLPDHVYQECDSNHVYDEFNRLLGEIGKIHSTWQGPTETALYLFGTSYEEMCRRLSGFIEAYPLCQKARLVQIA
ncbi:MAG: hypothetical protein ACK4UN_11200 [Limisphaerales bacterium]